MTISVSKSLDSLADVKFWGVPWFPFRLFLDRMFLWSAGARPASGVAISCFFGL